MQIFDILQISYDILQTAIFLQNIKQTTYDNIKIFLTFVA